MIRGGSFAIDICVSDRVRVIHDDVHRVSVIGEAES